MRFTKTFPAKFLILAFTFCNFLPSSTHSLDKGEKKKLVRYAREMGSRQIKYADSWQPPGESQKWVMDCSNTVRYTFQYLYGKKLPRTSLDQFLLAKKQGVYTSAPVDASGRITTEELVRDLRTGDVLFWENTYNVNRDPPISHVMIYLGKNQEGRMKMFGAGSRGKGEQTNNGGLDVYVFDPNRIMGCVKNDSGECTINSRFLGYARFFD